MQVIERKGYTRDEVLDVLHAKHNSRSVKFRYDLLDKNDRFVKTLDSVVSGEVSMQAFSTIKRTAKFTVKENYVKEHIGRQTVRKEQSYDADFSSWSVVSGAVADTGMIRMSSPDVSAISNFNFEGTYTSGLSSQWEAWNSANGTPSQVAGLTGSSAQNVNKTVSTNGAYGIRTASNYFPLAVTANTVVYLSFFFKKDASQVNPNYVYIMASDGAGNFCITADSNLFSYTDLGNGWFRFDGHITVTRAVNVGVLIGMTGTNTGSIRYDNVWLAKTAPVYDCEAWSPQLDWSDAIMIQDVARYSNSFNTFSKTFGTYNSSSGATQPKNEVYSRLSFDGGTTWTAWSLETDQTTLDGFPANQDTSQLKVQFKWVGQRWHHGEQISLDFLDAWMDYTRDKQMPETTEIDYLSNRIQPFMELQMSDGNWIDFPLGVFLLSTPTRHDELSGIYRDIEAYDGLVVLDDDKFTSRYFIAGGTTYTSAVRSILSSVGITKMNIQDSALAVGSAGIEFKVGTSKLEAVNQLLSALNYTPLWVDANGFYTASQYVSPADRAVDYEYQDDELSVIYNGMEHELDLYAVPNVWVAVQSNPEKTALMSTKTNSDPDSPTSTVNVGRNIVDFREVNDIADQTTLDAYVNRIAFESSQTFGKLKFKTALMPFHEYSDVLQIKYDALKIYDKFSETSWTMPLKAGAEMEHEVRKVVSI